MEALPAKERLCEMGVCLPFSGEGSGRHTLLELSPSHGTVREGRYAELWCIVSFYQRLGFQSADASVHLQ